MPVVSEGGVVEGMATMANITSQITRGRVKPEDAVSKVLYRQFKKIPLSTTLGVLSKMFDTDHFVLVMHTNRNFQGRNQVSEKTVVFGLATRIDLLDYIVKTKGEYAAPQTPIDGSPSSSNSSHSSHSSTTHTPSRSSASHSISHTPVVSGSRPSVDSTPGKKRHGECPVTGAAAGDAVPAGGKKHKR